MVVEGGRVSRGGASVVPMTKEEARSLVGRTVLLQLRSSRAEHVVIENAAEFIVAISWPGSERRDVVTAGDLLMPLPGEGADPVAVTQAALNDFAAAR